MTAPDTSKASKRRYRPYPTLRKFHEDISQVRGVMGPTGSGKSVGMIAEIMKRSREQEPDQNGWRRTRWAVVRETYPSLLQTTIKTWKEWVPQGKMIMSPPLRWYWKQENFCGDNTHIDIDVIFLSVKDPKADISKLRSLDVTGIWVNEAQELRDKVLIEWMLNRVGRFPDPQTAPLTWSGLIMDANAMPLKHWWYQWAEKLKPAGYAFFVQPPALIKCLTQEPDSVADACGVWWKVNPECENMDGQAKGGKYWLDQVSGKHTSWLEVNLCAQYGQSLDGKVVYPEFEEHRHVSKTELKPIPGLPLHLGFDWGLTPAVAISQITPAGQLRVIDECCAVSMGTRQFVRDALKPLLTAKYSGYTLVAVGEPSGNIRAQSDESTAMDEVRAQGIEISAAPTNLFKPRRDAVASFMLKRVRSVITGETTAEGFLISPTCSMLLEGFRGEYKLKSVLLADGTHWKDEPEDNASTHVQDALQCTAVTYDRPRVDSMARHRMGSKDGESLKIGFASDYPVI